MLVLHRKLDTCYLQTNMLLQIRKIISLPPFLSSLQALTGTIHLTTLLANVKRNKYIQYNNKYAKHVKFTNLVHTYKYHYKQVKIDNIYDIYKTQQQINYRDVIQ